MEGRATNKNIIKNNDLYFQTAKTTTASHKNPHLMRQISKPITKNRHWMLGIEPVNEEELP